MNTHSQEAIFWKSTPHKRCSSETIERAYQVMLFGNTDTQYAIKFTENLPEYAKNGTKSRKVTVGCPVHVHCDRFIFRVTERKSFPTVIIVVHRWQRKPPYRRAYTVMMMTTATTTTTTAVMMASIPEIISARKIVCWNRITFADEPSICNPCTEA